MIGHKKDHYDADKRLPIQFFSASNGQHISASASQQAALYLYHFVAKKAWPRRIAEALIKPHMSKYRSDVISRFEYVSLFPSKNPHNGVRYACQH